MAPAKVGIRQLADHLNISIGTVSRALNDRVDVNAETRQRVMAAAKALGYAPNQSGRSLRQGTTNVIGFMWQLAGSLEHYGEPFFVSVFDGVQAVFDAHQLDLMIFLNKEGEDPVGRVRRVIERGLVDALILPWTRTVDARLDYVAERNFPFVALGRSLSGGVHAWIDLDFEGAGRLAAERLIGFGHRRIGLGVPGHDLMQGRFFIEGYRAALTAAGIAFDPCLVVESDMTEGGGYHLTSVLMGDPDPPTALLLINTQMAVGTYRRLHEIGRRPGHDVAVLGGVMDSPLCSFLSPALSCFSLSPTALGTRLAHTLLEVMRRTSAETPTQELWPLTLMARESDHCVARG
jgi:DNA-binding LacI/PurR family transcriptional regulator